jgi:hypothetical protein
LKFFHLNTVQVPLPVNEKVRLKKNAGLSRMWNHRIANEASILSIIDNGFSVLLAQHSSPITAICIRIRYGIHISQQMIQQGHVSAPFPTCSSGVCAEVSWQVASYSNSFSFHQHKECSLPLDVNIY